MNYTRRYPGYWIALVAAALSIFACLSLLGFLAVLTGLRGDLFNIAAVTSSPNPSVESTGPLNPNNPIGKAPQQPSVSNAWPLDIVPMPAKADLGTVVGSREAFSVIADQDFDDVLTFYQDQMDALGWTKVSYGTRITKNDAELHYNNDVYHTTLILARIPFIGTLVEIRLREL